MKTAKLKEDLTIPGCWYYFVNDHGENDAVWDPPCFYARDLKVEVVKEGLASGLSGNVRAPHIPNGTHVAICLWTKYPATKDQIGVADMLVLPVTMLKDIKEEP